MLVLSPGEVRFAGAVWRGVTGVAVSRQGVRVAEAWSDAGPHAVFADVAEARVEVEVRQSLADGEPGDGPPLGAEGELSFERSSCGSDAGRETVRMRGVVVGVKVALPEAGGRAGGVRTVRLVALSADGASDPIRVTRAGEEDGA